MFVVGHISDLHLAARPRLTALAGKRGLGFINWHRKRKFIHRSEVVDALTRDLKANGPDHVAVTGDLINFSVPAEYARAQAWLEGLGPPSDVTVIPGNHDIYVPQAVHWPAKYWGEYMRGDTGDAGMFPFVRRRGAVALIALSSALPTGPFMATGFLGKQQLTGFVAALEETRGLFRIVLIHHPPKSPPSRFLRRLIDGAEFCRLLAAHGAELVLHGHDHCRSLIWLDGPGRAIPAVGVPSASARTPHSDEDAAAYNLYRIDGEPSSWRCELIARQRGADGGVREVQRLTLHPAATS